MCDSFYEPSDNWTDNIGDGYGDSYSISVDERMAADPICYEELEEAWNSYADEDNIQFTSNEPSSLDILMDYMITSSGQTQFNVHLRDGTIWTGYMYRFYAPPTLITLPKFSHNYNGYDSFNNPRGLVNFILERSHQTLLQNDEDPLDFIWTTGDNGKSWTKILQELNDNIQ